MDKLEYIQNNLELQELTTEATNQIKTITTLLGEVDTLSTMHNNDTLSTENASVKIPNLLEDQDIATLVASFDPCLTSEDSSTRIKMSLKQDDFSKKINIFIYNIFKIFYKTFRKIMSKIVIAGSHIEDRNKELVKELAAMSDDLAGSEITIRNVKENVLDLIGGYTMQNDNLELDGGLITALISLKDYSKIGNTLTNLEKWNSKVMTQEGVDSSYSEFRRDGIRSKLLTAAWSEDVDNKNLAGTLLKINSGLSRYIADTGVISISNTSIDNTVFKELFDTGNTLFTAYSVVGRAVKTVLGYNDGIGLMSTAVCNIKSGPETVRIEYPSINLLRMFIKRSIAVDYKELDKSVTSTIKDIEKNTKQGIDKFVNDRINLATETEKGIGLAMEARNHLTHNLNAMNKVALDSVIDAVSNHNNLLKYAELMVNTIKLETNKKD